MLSLGMPEMLMILAIALIVIGPKKLPDLAKTLGRAMGEFKRSAQDFKRSIDIENTANDVDAATAGLKETVREINTGNIPEDSDEPYADDLETNQTEDAAGEREPGGDEAEPDPESAPDSDFKNKKPAG